MSTRSTARKSAPLVPSVPELDPVTTEELKLAAQAGQVIAAWLGQAKVFLVGAKAIEVEAETALGESKARRAPQTAEEDEALQLAIKHRNGIKSRAMEHWKPITATVHDFHRRLTARRDRAVKAAEEAATLDNRLHNTYVEQKRREADERDRRERQEKEAAAQRERDAELAALELQRLDAESALETLSEREAKFVDLYCGRAGHLAEPQRTVWAAQQAGYANPRQQAERLMDTAKIVKAIEAMQQAAAVEAQKKAIESRPLDIQHETVQPDVRKASGVSSRTTWAAELTDEQALIQAAIAGLVPGDVLQINRVRLNEYARNLKTLLNGWPGVRAVPTTKQV